MYALHPTTHIRKRRARPVSAALSRSLSTHASRNFRRRWRRSRRRRGLREVHRGHLAIRRVRHLEVWLRLRADDLRRERRREFPDARVVVLRPLVVVAARDRDPILRARQLILQPQKTLVR